MPEFDQTALQAPGFNRPYAAFPPVVALHCRFRDEQRLVKLGNSYPKLRLLAQIDPRRRIVALDEDAPLFA